MNRLITSLFIAFAATTAMAQATAEEAYSSYYENLPVDVQQVNVFDVPAHEMKLTDFGAVGDGKTINTEAFARAISALTKQGGGTLIVPQGIYMTGPIALKDNIRLHLERGAIVMASEDKRLFLNKDPKARVRPLVSASKRRNIMITGEGCIDGNGAQWRPVKRQKVSDVEWKQFLKMGGTVTDEGQLWFPFNLKHAENIADTPEAQENMRADLLRLTDCENVVIEGITVQNSPRFHVHPVRCKNVVINGVTVRCPWNAQNGDAIDISNCQRVLIVNSIIDAGDDGICMKGGSGQQGLEDGPCEDVLIEDNTVYHAHGGFVIGSDVSGGMNRIVVRRCRFSDTDTGLRFKSGIGRGGKTENIFISDIVMTDITQQAIVFECTYVDRKYAVNTKDEGGIKTQGSFAPDFRDIHISDVVCHNVPVAIKAVGLPDMKCVSDIHISDSHFTYSSKACDIDPHCLLDIEQTTFTKLGSEL